MLLGSFFPPYGVWELNSGLKDHLLSSRNNFYQKESISFGRGNSALLAINYLSFFSVDSKDLGKEEQLSV